MKNGIKAVGQMLTVECQSKTTDSSLRTIEKQYIYSMHDAVGMFSDCIVTRNKKDYRKSVIPVYTIDELMSLM